MSYEVDNAINPRYKYENWSTDRLNKFPNLTHDREYSLVLDFILIWSLFTLFCGHSKSVLFKIIHVYFVVLEGNW